jgi:hypothetical protein
MSPKIFHSHKTSQQPGTKAENNEKPKAKSAKSQKYLSQWLCVNFDNLKFVSEEKKQSYT